MRKRAATVSALLAGQKITITTWTHDIRFYAGDVVINLNVWPGLATGDLIQVTRAGASNSTPGSGFMFLVDDDSIAGVKSPMVSHRPTHQSSSASL